MTGLGTVRRVPSPNRVTAKPHGGPHPGRDFAAVAAETTWRFAGIPLDASWCAFRARKRRAYSGPKSRGGREMMGPTRSIPEQEARVRPGCGARRGRHG
jgi:hypothetical protein